MLRQQQELNVSPNLSEMFFIEQIAAFGNACGTIAVLHTLTNIQGAIGPASKIYEFRQKTSSASPKERGTLLVGEESLKASSDNAAADAAAQTAVPERDGPDLDHHFVAFLPFNGRLVELDGTKPYPVDQ